MLPSRFTDDEKEFLLSHQGKWEETNGGKHRDAEGNLTNERDEFISSLIEDFFAKFPVRDLAANPTSPTVFTQQERDRLHTVLHVILSPLTPG